MTDELGALRLRALEKRVQRLEDEITATCTALRAVAEERPKPRPKVKGKVVELPSRECVS